MALVRWPSMKVEESVSFALPEIPPAISPSQVALNFFNVLRYGTATEAACPEAESDNRHVVFAAGLIRCIAQKSGRKSAAPLISVT